MGQKQNTARGVARVPFLSSIVTVSFWHFIKNLLGKNAPSAECRATMALNGKRAQLFASARATGWEGLPDELHGGGGSKLRTFEAFAVGRERIEAL